MPNQPRPSNPHRSVRFEDVDWSDGDKATEAMDTSRGAILNQFFRWYLRRPGAKLPARPPAEIMDEIVKAREALDADEPES